MVEQVNTDLTDHVMASTEQSHGHGPAPSRSQRTWSASQLLQTSPKSTPFAPPSPSPLTMTPPVVPSTVATASASARPPPLPFPPTPPATPNIVPPGMFAPGAMHASAINLGDPAGALLGVMPSPGMVPPSIVPVPGSPMVQLPPVPMPPGTPMVPGMPMPPGTPMIPGTTMPPVMIPGAMFQPVPVPTPQPLARPPSFPLSHPRTITTHYRVGVPIGQGGCAYVFRGQRRVDGMPVAIKFIERRRIPADRMVVVPGRVGTTGVATSQLAVPIEVYVLRQLDHPSIVKLVDFLADERYFYVVTELHGVEWRRRRLRSPPSPDAASQIASSHSSSQTDSASSLATGSSRDLFECIEAHGRLGEHQARHIFRQVVSAVEYMRSRHVYHMDIKDENLVVDAGFNVKFIDFGSTEIVDVSTAGVDTSLETFRGTYAYAPPEVLTGNRFQPESTEVWSLGTLLYTMIFGQAPFSTHERAIAGDPDPPRLGDERPVTHACLDLLSGMLQPNPLHRISLDAVFKSAFVRGSLTEREEAELRTAKSGSEAPRPTPKARRKTVAASGSHGSLGSTRHKTAPGREPRESGSREVGGKRP